MIDPWEQRRTRGEHFSKTTAPAGNDAENQTSGSCGQVPDCSILQRLDATQQLAGIGDWEYDLASDTIIWSRNVFRLLGRNPFQGHMSLEEYLFNYPAANSARLQETIHRAIQHNERRTVEVRAQLGNGNSPLHRCTFIPVCDRDGTVARINCYLQEVAVGNPDCTDHRKSAANNLTSWENPTEVHFRLSIPDGTYEYINPRVLELTGYPPRDWYRNPSLIREILFPGWRGKFDLEFRRFLAGGTDSDLIFPILTRQRVIRWIRLRAALFRDHAGETIAIEGVATDVTDRKREASERRQLIRHLRKVLAGKHSSNGLIPICSHCKKVKDDQGLWQQIELFLAQHGKLFFTHGLCPDCLAEHYPQYMFKRSVGKQEP